MWKITLSVKLHTVCTIIQGASEKKVLYFSYFRLISVPEVRFCFFTSGLESKFWTHFIQPLKLYPLNICSALKTKKCMGGYDIYPSLSLRLRFKHCPVSMHLVALDCQNITGFSVLTFNENGRRWKYKDVFCIPPLMEENYTFMEEHSTWMEKTIQKSCQCVRFYANFFYNWV